VTEPIKAGKYYRCMNGSIVHFRGNNYIGHIVHNQTGFIIDVVPYLKYGSVADTSLLGAGFTLDIVSDVIKCHILCECLQAEINFYKTKNHGG
jgi:hypothetical protein